MADTRREKDPLGLARRSRRRALRRADAAREAELSDQRLHAARRVHRRAGVDQEGRGAHAQGDRPPRPRSSPTPSSQAADEVLAGQHRDQFIVDPYQAGAGHVAQHERERSARESRQRAPRREARRVRARASERPREHGAVDERHDPDEHPAGVSVAARAVQRARSRISAARCAAKGVEFDDIVKAGRTHLQDAMPIRLGQEFTRVRRARSRAASSASTRPRTTCATSASAAARWAQASRSKRNIRR